MLLLLAGLSSVMAACQAAEILSEGIFRETDILSKTGDMNAVRFSDPPCRQDLVPDGGVD